MDRFTFYFFTTSPHQCSFPFFLLCSCATLRKIPPENTASASSPPPAPSLLIHIFYCWVLLCLVSSQPLVSCVKHYSLLSRFHVSSISYFLPSLLLSEGQFCTADPSLCIGGLSAFVGFCSLFFFFLFLPYI
eukprot:TRINITY_DN14242_c0_g1_i1.p1 TRINITY_DN14242_c0_g1~~TRINITY_DN14242_c0_g1_i1.p1  ORF type:complete len:132 (+),score=6.71 TRINITY_DN14242_c0_g1_i1:178-573(+)